MADDLLEDGTSPWGDQVSLSNHNSSSSSLVLGSPPPQGPHEEDPMSASLNPEATSSTVATSPPTAASNMSASTPALPSSATSPTTSSRRNSRGIIRGRRGKLSKSVQLESEEGEGPLGNLGPLGEVQEEDSEDVATSTAAAAATAAAGSGQTEQYQKAEDQHINRTVDVERGLNALRVSKDDIEPAVKHNATKEADEKFEITVGDPTKVGDLTSAHTVYTVHTKTSSKEYSKPEFSVSRRYKDFRWVFHALENNNPGVIVPPPPEKQAVGRFNEDFVEARRAALENMLNKVATHPTLQKDADFKLFLESEQFSQDIKHRIVNMDESHDLSGGSSKGGFMSSLGGAFSFSSKYTETNEWFIDKKHYMDNLESQLKSLSKALDLVVAQRRELSDATGEFANVLGTLSTVEISKSLTDLLENFSNAQTQIKDLYSRQCMQDILSLATTLDEYIRLISSIRSVFLQRQKAFMNVQTAEQDLAKKRQHLDKLHRQGKTLQDKIAQVTHEVEEQEKRVVDLRVVFDDISKAIMGEFERFEHDKVRDFRNSVELFLENAIESQKAAIEIWETFYSISGLGGAAAQSSSSHANQNHPSAPQSEDNHEGNEDATTYVEQSASPVSS